MNTTTLYERFPTKEERDLWWEYQRHETYARHSTTEEEKLWNENEADLIQEKLMDIRQTRLDKEEERKRKGKPILNIVGRLPSVVECEQRDPRHNLGPCPNCSFYNCQPWLRLDGTV